MALPKLNNANYELTLPSTGKQLKYRPFLVKEQKALMIAQESEDDKLIENTFAQIISDCVLDEIDPYKLPMFDIEYIFLRIRGKSVGEKVQLKLLCPDDKKDKRRYGLRLIEAFPKTIEGTDLNQGTNNEIIKTSVSFSFRYWQTLDKKDFGTYPLSNAIFDTISGTVERTISANLPKIISKFI